jgi:hypothetical protein
MTLTDEVKKDDPGQQMTSTEEVKKEDPPFKKRAPINLKAWVGVGVSILLFVLLIVWAVRMVRTLVNSEPVTVMKAPTMQTRTKIVSTLELEAYTLLTDQHLTVIQGTNDPEDIKAKDGFRGRYLLTKVIAGTEIKPDMLAPFEANTLLGNSVMVTIPATPTSSLGGQLRVGDMIELLLVPATRSAESKNEPLEALVLNVPVQKADDKNPTGPGGITLALATDKREKFASALPGSTIVITRKVPVR